MIRLRGANLVLAGGVVTGGALAIADGRLVEVGADAGPRSSGVPGDVDCTGGWIVPGFVDTHIHGSHGIDVLAGGDAVARVAALLPRYGVTGFLPTALACPPEVLAAFLTAVDACQAAPAGAARVLGAHLESNFINPDYQGAQPAHCLRLPPSPGDPPRADGAFTGGAILATIDAHRAVVRIVTLAPELPGGLDLVRRLAGAGHRVSLGHSAATYEQGVAAIAAGARHATHLFNRMPPLSHRAPGLAGAVLGAGPEVTCEVIGDGHHVHAAMVRLAVQAKGPGGIVAITDATAAAGLPVGATARLGEHTIHVREGWAELADGTLAGSVATMDGVFRWLARDVGLGVVAAAQLTATAPADALGRPDLGRLAVGGMADFVVLDDALRVRQTWVAGVPVWNPGASLAVFPTGGQQ
jgi:N-acetylglucosamine-6-phosphate deacetylase